MLPYQWSNITSCCVTLTSHPYHHTHHRKPLRLPTCEHSLPTQCTPVEAFPALWWPSLHSCLYIWPICPSRPSCFSVQTLSVMEATVRNKSSDKLHEKWQLLAEMLRKNVVCKYSRLQIIRGGFLAFLNTNEDLSRPTANEVSFDLSINGFFVDVPQKIISKKNCDHMECR